MALTDLTAADLAARIKARSITSRDAVDACLERIDALDPKVHAFLSVHADSAREAAEGIDRQLAAGQDPGPLAGVPVAVKDNICVQGMNTTCASRILHSYRPPYNAHVADALRNAGAVLLGKTNLDEFAMGTTTENSGFGPTRNPWNLERIPGGSSGGSAAAVAAGFAPLALGSDTGGSIRTPASFCGCVGFKPSYGLVSRRGLVAYGSSLDQIGPFSRTVADAALLLDAIAIPDERDSTSRPESPPSFANCLGKGVDGLKIGIPKEYFEADGLSEEVRRSVLAAIDLLKSDGASVTEISLPMLAYAIPTYYIIATAEASSNLARYDGVHYGHRTEEAKDIIDLFSASREEAFGTEVKRRIMLGTYVLSAGYYDAYYLRALRVRTRIADDFARAFGEVDVIASPVAPDTACRLGEKTADPLAMYLLDIYTTSANLAAIPGISVPCGTDAKGMPIGLQLMAARFQDEQVFRAAAAYERASGLANRVAPLT